MRGRRLTALLVVSLSGALPAQEPAKTSGVTAADPFPTASAAEVGLDPTRLDTLVDAVVEHVASGDPVGAELLVIKNRRTVVHEAFGWRDRELERPFEKNTICRIRSMTKPIVATGIWQLVGDGELRLQDPVARHIEAFDNELSRSITIDHLLTHTGGFGHPGYPAQLTSYGSLRAAVDASGSAGPDSEVGAGYRYSDVDSATLAAVVAEIAGQPVESYIAQHILGPLRMTDTFCNFDPNDPRAARVSSTYVLRDGQLVKYWDPSREQQLPFFRGSGGIYSTPMDYARFLAAWMDRGSGPDSRLVPEGLIPTALASTVMSASEATPRHYARHWEVHGPVRDEHDVAEHGLPVFGHTGSDGTAALCSPEQDLMVLYFTQSRRAQNYVSVIRRIIELLKG